MRHLGEKSLIGAFAPDRRFLLPQDRVGLGALADFEILFVTVPEKSPKARMAHGNVIALGVIFDEEFPVEIAFQGSNRPKGLHLGKAVVTRLVGSCGHQVCDTLPF